MIIDGRQLAKDRELLLKKKVDQFTALRHRRPSLLAIELFADPGSKLYLKLKKAAAERIGIEMKVCEVYETSHLFVKFRRLHKLHKAGFDGIFIQHPPGYDKQKWQKMVDQIPPEKDVDCLTSINLGLIKEGKPRFFPATVKAAIYCLLFAFCQFDQLDKLDQLGKLLNKKRIVILGRSPILGLPLSWHLENLGASVTLLHSESKNIKQKTKNADILISSVGKPKIVTGDMVKEGVIAIDCGSPVGDIDFDSVGKKAAAITPVPGGVGPLTVVSLMENVVESAYHADREGS